MLIFLVMGAGMAGAEDDSGFTGGGTAPIPNPAPVKITHRKHKTKKATAVSTNTVAKSPVPTNGGTILPPAVVTNALAASTNAAAKADAPAEDGRVATMAVTDLRDFEADPPAVKQLLTDGLALTTRNLSYKYGSSDPQAGGMDCSGTVYYLLMRNGVEDVPRDASEMYRWVWKQGRFNCVVSSSQDTFELERLQPGDLLFWSGTYHVDRDPPITHVMIYLGIDGATGKRVMVGASEGRRFNGKSRYGVSVFDFTIPREEAAPEGSSSETQARFVGYGAVPGLGDKKGAFRAQ